MDPIFTTCLVVFIVACVAVLAVYVDEEFVASDSYEVAYGDTVEVNYTGTFYAPYGEEYAVVFDTSVSGIGEDDDVLKSNSFSRSSYGTISVTVGKGTYLEMFEMGLIGHMVGDKFVVEMPIGDGYVAPESSFHENVSTTLSIPLVQEMTKTQFDALYGGIDLTGGSSVAFDTVYGWPGLAAYDTSSNMVVVINLPESGETYEYAGNEDNPYGKVSFEVASVNQDITAVMTFEDYTVVDEETGEIQMIELNLDGNVVYVTNINGDEYTYKTCSETYNIVLYFEIEVVSIS